jgi:hypothetical protein
MPQRAFVTMPDKDSSAIAFLYFSRHYAPNAMPLLMLSLIRHAADTPADATFRFRHFADIGCYAIAAFP